MSEAQEIEISDSEDEFDPKVFEEEVRIALRGKAHKKQERGEDRAGRAGRLSSVSELRVKIDQEEPGDCEVSRSYASTPSAPRVPCFGGPGRGGRGRSEEGRRQEEE